MQARAAEGHGAKQGRRLDRVAGDGTWYRYQNSAGRNETGRLATRRDVQPKRRAVIGEGAGKMGGRLPPIGEGEAVHRQAGGWWASCARSRPGG